MDTHIPMIESGNYVQAQTNFFIFGWFGHMGSVGPNQVACRKDNHLTFSNILKKTKNQSYCDLDFGCCHDAPKY